MNHCETHQNISMSELAGKISEAVVVFFERDINSKDLGAHNYK